jgi:hypothetical protein
MKTLESLKSSLFEDLKQHQIADMSKIIGGDDVYKQSYKNGTAIDCWRFTDDGSKDADGNIIYINDGPASDKPCDQ